MLTPEQWRSIRWHMIGHLQTNKVQRVIRWADMIQSVDSVRLATAINRHAAQANTGIRCLAQINISAEQSKYGVNVNDAGSFISELQTFSHIKLVGIMGMAPFQNDPEQTRPYFRQLRRVFELAAAQAVARGTEPLSVLSMGMSDDFLIAIEEGSTVIRIGSALFGG